MSASNAFPKTEVEWLAKLVSFNTVSRDSNFPLIEFVQRYLQSAGIQTELVYGPEKVKKANLWATLPAKDGSTQGGIILSGHTDVVPVDGQKWDSDPFTLTERGDNYYGRGACDMKGFIAVVLSLVPTFQAMTNRTKPIHFAFSYDEELGCVGVQHLISTLKERQFKADACVIGEPTGMEVFIGNKGRSGWTVKVTGKAIHSSMALMNTSCNAIEYAAMIIAKIREIAVELRENGPRDESYQCAFAPISTGLIQGGNAVNTVPAECAFTFSVRVTEPTTAKRVADQVQSYIDTVILPAMRKECAEASVSMTTIANYPPFNGNPKATLTLRACESKSVCHGDAAPRKMAGGTEAGYFQDTLGVPCVIVGPGDLAIAHQANEFVSKAQLTQSKAFVTDMVTLYTTMMGASRM